MHYTKKLWIVLSLYFTQYATGDRCRVCRVTKYDKNNYVSEMMWHDTCTHLEHKKASQWILYIYYVEMYFNEQEWSLSAAPQAWLTRLFSYFIIPASDIKPPTKHCTNTNSAQNKWGVCVWGCIFFFIGEQKRTLTPYSVTASHLPCP